MKKIIFLSIIFSTIITFFLACEKEESVTINDFQVYVNSVGTKTFTKVESAPYSCDSSQKMRFLVKTSKDVVYYVTAWPGQRLLPILKSKVNPAVDSVFSLKGENKTVYTSNTNYNDYGIPNAKGIIANRTDSGYVVDYVYTKRGTYKLVMFITTGNKDYKTDTKSFDIVVK